MPSKTGQIVCPKAVSGLMLRGNGQVRQEVPLMQWLLSAAQHHVHQIFQLNMNSSLLATVVLYSAFQGSYANQLKDKNSHFSYIDIWAAIKIFQEVSEFTSSQSLPFLPFSQSTAILPSFTEKPSGIQRSYCQIHLSMCGYGSPCSHMLGKMWLFWSRSSTAWLRSGSFIRTLRRSEHVPGQAPPWREKALTLLLVHVGKNASRLGHRTFLMHRGQMGLKRCFKFCSDSKIHGHPVSVLCCFHLCLTGIKSIAETQERGKKKSIYVYMYICICLSLYG